MNIQSHAAKIIDKVVSQKKSLTEVLDTDQALLQEICYGTLRFYHKLDAIAKLLLHHSSKKVDSLIYSLILVGLYQLLHLRIPPHAVLNETVAATRTLQKSWAASFVNAILRNFTRQQEKILQQIEADIVAKYSHPLWFIKKLQQSWPKNWCDILATNNKHPPMHLRINLQKISRADYLKKLEALEIKAKPVYDLPAAIILEKPCDVLKLPGFKNGFVSVQDLSAQRAAILLELKPNLRVLDACCAPGGKTSHILELEPKLQELVAIDISEERLKMVKDNLKRLQLSAKLIVGDATKPKDWWDNKKFDRILLDAPCSGTGVIRRHPDIKILRKPQDITNNAQLQFKLLEALWPLLNDSGLLVYVTCSILPEENFLIVKKFLQKYDMLKEKPIPGKQLLPSVAGGDGFYYAILTKVK